MSAPAELQTTLMLVGGSEFLPGGEAADSWWLARARSPRVTLLPTANRDHPEAAVNLARSYFATIGAELEPCWLLRPADAARPALLAQLEGAGAVYLAGGDPGWLLEVLLGSPAAECLGTLFRRGVPLAGSSAGAMALVEHCLLPGDGFRTRPGLGLVAGVALAPHWDTWGGSWRGRLSGLGLPVLAVDERTGVCWDGTSWTVRGAGGARLITAEGERGLDAGGLAAPIQ